MVHGDIEGETCARISSSWMLFGRPPLIAQCVDHDVRLYYDAVQNMVYGCGNVPQIIAESSDTPPIYCAQHMQQSVGKPSHFPQAYNATPFKWLKLSNRIGIILP